MVPVRHNIKERKMQSRKTVELRPSETKKPDKLAILKSVLSFVRLFTKILSAIDKCYGAFCKLIQYFS
jgi:hypothetical protein